MITNQEEGSTIFWDMDGVLVDLDGHLQATNQTIGDCWGKKASWWANLPPTELFAKYGRAIRQSYILSSPANGPCAAGKIAWVDHHLGRAYRRERLILCTCKHVLAGANRILVDDYLKNCVEWQAAGGTAIHLEATPASYQRIEDIVNRMGDDDA